MTSAAIIEASEINGQTYSSSGQSIDTIKYTLSQANYTLAVGDGNSNVTEISTDTNDAFSTIERVVFADIAIALDTDGANSAGGIYRTYKAAFNRTPEETGFGYWIDRADNGASAVQMAEEFVWGAEFQALYGVTTNDDYLDGNDIVDINNAGDGTTYIFGEAGNDTMRVKTVALETTDLISGASVVTLGALRASTVNTVTLLGYSATTAVTGSSGADSLVNSSGGNSLATDSTNSNDTCALAGGTDTLSYLGNIHGAASGTSSAGATTNGYAMNFTAANIEFDNTPVSSATNITILTAGKVAQYDLTAVSSISTAAGNIVAVGETDTVSGIKIVIGSGLNDYIAAASAGMTITGGAGVDIIVAGAGTDNIVLDQTTVSNDSNVTDFTTGTDKLVVSVALFDAAAGGTPLATLGGAETAIGAQFTSVANAVALGGGSVGGATNVAMFLHLQDTGAIYFNDDAATGGGLTPIGSLGATSTLVDADWTLVA